MIGLQIASNDEHPEAGAEDEDDVNVAADDAEEPMDVDRDETEKKEVRVCDFLPKATASIYDRRERRVAALMHEDITALMHKGVMGLGQ